MTVVERTTVATKGTTRTMTTNDNDYERIEEEQILNVETTANSYRRRKDVRRLNRRRTQGQGVENDGGDRR